MSIPRRRWRGKRPPTKEQLGIKQTKLRARKRNPKRRRLPRLRAMRASEYEFLCPSDAVEDMRFDGRVRVTVTYPLHPNFTVTDDVLLKCATALALESLGSGAWLRGVRDSVRDQEFEGSVADACKFLHKLETKRVRKHLPDRLRIHVSGDVNLSRSFDLNLPGA